MEHLFTITELTREFGISTRTLRFYEDEELIKPVRQGRTRLYSYSDRHLLRQILRARRIGFSIDDIRAMLPLYMTVPSDAAGLHGVLERITETRQTLRQTRRDLEEFLQDLDRAEDLCVERLAELGVNT